MDILVLRGGWETPQRKSLLRNNCNGTFTDVTKEAAWPSRPRTQTAVWADINNDGFLDLYVGNENGPNQLSSTKATEHSKTSPRSAGIDRIALYQRRGGGRLRQRRLRGFLRFQLPRRQLSLSTTTTTAHLRMSRKQAGVPGRPWLRRVVLRLRQRRLAGLVGRPAITCRWKRRVQDLPGAAAQRRDPEALPEPGQRRIPRRDQGNRAGQGLHADGGEFRRRG